jgi:hypothetical protein
MSNADLVLVTLISLVDRAATVGALLQKAKAEGRDITDAELDQLASEDDAERARGQAEREKARLEGG